MLKWELVKEGGAISVDSKDRPYFQKEAKCEDFLVRVGFVYLFIYLFIYYNSQRFPITGNLHIKNKNYKKKAAL